MTKPRQVLPGQTYLITRRCTQRQYLLRPDDTTTQLFLYTIGDAATRYGIELIAWHASSNHYHAVVHDPVGNLPLFLERFHKLSARALNARWKRWENLWSAEAPCAVRLIEDADVIDKVVYTLANPVMDDLVEHVFDWPGANSLRFTRAEPHTIVVNRPIGFFRKDGPMPKSVTLAVATPPAHRDNREAWVQRIHEAVREKERVAQQQRQFKRKGVIGRRQILAASAFDRPSTQEPRRNLRPHIACLNRERRVRELAALQEFRVAHTVARELFSGGQRDVVFPAGTFQMRVIFGVTCTTYS